MSGLGWIIWGQDAKFLGEYEKQTSRCNLLRVHSTIFIIIICMMQILKQIQIPYSFAKRHGVLLRYEGDQIFIVRRKDTARIALQEARRILGKSANDQLCTDQEFHALLSSSYAGDTGESQQVAAGYHVLQWRALVTSPPYCLATWLCLAGAAMNHP